uniref:Uncharacterized protein n=1 Tax=Arundo donax TaxID=35708 RepID=A0A0A9BED9_ARUDO
MVLARSQYRPNISSTLESEEANS